MKEFKNLEEYLLELFKYEPPYTIQELKEKYPHLLKDPAHRWRAENGIELIHKEPDRKEQIRIWNNWNRMNNNMKKKSDKKSMELFGMSNKDHHEYIMKKYY